jgi:hypothetical protein
MTHQTRIRLGLAPGLALAATLALAEAPKSMKATGSVELDERAGDARPMSTSDGDIPGLDVVHVRIASDGKRLAFAVTLKDPPGVFASSALNAYLDTDLNPKTGVDYHGLPGFDYKVKVESCVDYADSVSACEGGSKAKPKAHWAAINVDRLKDSSAFGDTVVDSMGFGDSKASARTPVAGKVLEGGFDYADLGLKSGQTIRVVLEENDDMDDVGDVPEILLTLK